MSDTLELLAYVMFEDTENGVLSVIIVIEVATKTYALLLLNLR